MTERGQQTAAPQMVGKYQIDGVLGQGAMGVVYAGHDPDIDRQVAIKTVHGHLINAEGSDDWLDRFAREARAAGRVLHPNLVTVFDYLQQDGAPYLVMERIAADTLEARLRAGPPPAIGEVHDILRQMLSGLAAIHAQGIVHRDLKPANVMLTADGHVKLADFGVARITTLEATVAGMIGTPSYMAPEQFAGRSIDARADIFACGVLLYLMVTGKKPYAEKDLTALMAAVQAGNATAPNALVSNIPDPLNDLILKAMAPDPADRFQDAASMSEALASALPRDLASVQPDFTVVVAKDPVAPSAAKTMVEKISPDTLSEVSRILTEKLGPMGKVIAKRAAQDCTSTDTMVEAALRELGGYADKDALKRDLRAALDAPQPATSAGVQSQAQTALSDLLKPHLGPITPVLVKRHAARATNLPDLVQRLGNEISDPVERDRFLMASKPIMAR